MCVRHLNQGGYVSGIVLLSFACVLGLGAAVAAFLSPVVATIILAIGFFFFIPGHLGFLIANNNHIKRGFRTGMWVFFGVIIFEFILSIGFCLVVAYVAGGILSVILFLSLVADLIVISVAPKLSRDEREPRPKKQNIVYITSEGQIVKANAVQAVVQPTHVYAQPMPTVTTAVSHGEAAVMAGYCTGCGHPRRMGDVFCGKCGKPQDST